MKKKNPVKKAAAKKVSPTKKKLTKAKPAYVKFSLLSTEKANGKISTVCSFNGSFDLLTQSISALMKENELMKKAIGMAVLNHITEKSLNPKPNKSRKK